MSDDRCDYSDLRPEHCAHCGARPGDDGLTLAPVTPLRHAAPAGDPVPLERPRLPATWAPSATDSECRCGKPTRDGAWLCDGCEKRLTDTLCDLTELDDEVVTTMTRQTGAAITGGSRSATTPLPWHEKAADARRTLHGMLATWVRFCDEEQVRGPVVEFPADTIPAMSAYLATRVHGLALLDIGPEAMDEITDAAAECHRLVFWKRKNRLYLGPCETPIEVEDGEPEVCPGEVYADEGEPVGFCNLCEQGVTVVIRRADLEKRLDGYLATAAEIARLATFLGLDVPRDTVRKRVHYWHRHKRIVPKREDADGAPMFAYGEVRGMLYKEFGARVS